MNEGELTVAKKAEVWKGKLLDVSNRNPLIRFKKNKASTLTVALPGSDTLYGELDRGRQFTVLGDPEGKEEVGSGRMIVVAHAPETPVERVLYNLRGKSRTYRSDHGVNILYVSMGSLLWKEEGSSDLNESPLFLVPVSLERQNSFSPYRLMPLDEDPVFNPSLRKRLEMDYRLKLPDFDLDNGFELGRALDAVREAIPAGSGWQVSASAYLGLFHFSKLLMYADLDDGISSLASSPVIRALAGDPSALPPEPSDLPSPAEYDAKLRPEDSFQVLDADSSQLEAVQAALAGVSFVLQGPPGTGKSQTITNMMAELMAHGKRVLFVSQKMAALDVVKGNLEKVGLGDRCLELHDPKRNRADIVKEIAQVLERSADPRSAPPEVRDLAAVRQELDDYVKALHAPRGRLGTSVYGMIGHYASLSGVRDLRFQMPSAMEVDEDRLGRMEGMVHRLSQMSAAFMDREHPWNGAAVAEWSDRMQSKMVEELSAALEARQKLWSAIPGAVEALGLVPPESLPDLRRIRALYRDLVERPEVRREWLEGDLDTLAGMVADGKAAFADLQAKEQGLLGMGSRDILDLDGKTFRYRFEVQYNSGLRALKGGFRRDMKILTAISGRKLSYEEAKFMVRAVEGYQQSLAAWKVMRDNLMTRLRGCFSGEGSELTGISERMEWTRRFRSAHALLMNDKVAEALTSTEPPQPVRDRALELELYLGRFESALNPLSARFVPEHRLNGRAPGESALRDLEAWTETLWNGRYRFQEWLDLSSLLHGMRALGLEDLLRELHRDGVPAEEMSPAFLKRFRRLWTEEALASDPALHRFRRDHQAGLVQRFHELDRLYVERGRHRVQARVEEALRKRREGSERAALLKQETEIARLAKLKRQRKAVRSMLSECWDLVGLLKPCMLMSPLSVAQFLDRERTRFDVVIFDEASQICPEDAIGSIARGTQVIVVGDSRQMPPTSFFALSSEEEDSEDLESILDECETCGMSKRMLMWHYRSKDESLIAFSNHQFYGGRLNTFPSALFGREGFGVHHVHVPNGVFDRGRSRTNREEALIVANMVRDHYARKDGKSLGVIAFSEAQMEAVDQALDDLRRQDRELDEVLSSDQGEPFLLYNLENVQGHERDRIILSVGYGRDENGRFALNFGPLNREGGERRLNVAITRAKQSLDIVSSIRSEDIDLSGTRSAGARLLKQYLAFAEAGGDRRALPLPPGRKGEEVGPFQDRLRRELEDRGHRVKVNVGTSDYRVDLAIEDPAEEGRFLLGIECDGEHYLSGRTVRDRDRTRQSQLGRLGWNLHRVWSVEWFRNPHGELDRIDEAVRALRERSAS